MAGLVFLLIIVLFLGYLLLSHLLRGHLLHHTSSSWSSRFTYYCFDQPIKLAIQFNHVGLQKFIHHHVFDAEE
jgi:hypothetical protein